MLWSNRTRVKSAAIFEILARIRKVLSQTNPLSRPGPMNPPSPSTSWLPPAQCRGMLKLDRTRFRKTIKIPMLDVSEISLNSALPHLKPMLFKMERLKPMHVAAGGAKKVLLHPILVKSWYDLPDEVRNSGITGAHLTWEDLEIGYENWKAEEILRAVLPEKQESLTSFSRVGHILHVNLRDHLMPYKALIGEVLRDKVPNIRAVVNKSQTIDNTYRNFQLELICGEADYKVEVKENGITFEFDFSSVYWNPRLSTEHERIIKLMQPGDVLYDVFAGVGPFSIPAGKKKCSVLANDLNPESYKWLQHNAKRNKVTPYVTTTNKDGRDFIRDELRTDLLRRWQESNDEGFKPYRIHIAMNLPAMAVEFLDAFRGLVPVEAIRGAKHAIMPIVHAYCFAKGDNLAEIAQSLAEHHLGEKLGDNLEGIHFVRNVAPNKDMFRVSFHLTEQLLTTTPPPSLEAECTESKGIKRTTSQMEEGLDEPTSTNVELAEPACKKVS